MNREDEIDHEKWAQALLGALGAYAAPYWIYHQLAECKPYKVVSKANIYGNIGLATLLCTLGCCLILSIVMWRSIRSMAVAFVPSLLSAPLAWGFYKIWSNHYGIEMPLEKPPGDFAIYRSLEIKMASDVLELSILVTISIAFLSAAIALFFAVRRRKKSAYS